MKFVLFKTRLMICIVNSDFNYVTCVAQIDGRNRMHKGDVRMSKCPVKHPTKEIYSEECKDPENLVVLAHIITGRTVIEKAKSKREWMDKTPDKFANRCLPLISANELGWVINSPADFSAWWDGTDNINGVKIESEDPLIHGFAISHFGSGVLTFHPGYLFETTVGHGLYVKGPTNSYKKFIYPLEGLVETDWLTFTFTMNWKFTEPRRRVFFKRGEPICQIFPYPRDYVNKFDAIKKPMAGEMKEHYSNFSCSRNEHNQKLHTKGTPENEKNTWQKNYFKGQYHDGTKCSELGFKHEPRCGAKKFSE